MIKPETPALSGQNPVTDTDSTQPNLVIPPQRQAPVDPKQDTAEVKVNRGSLPAWLINFAAESQEESQEPEENLRNFLMAELEAEDELAKAVLAPDDPGLELPAGNATADNQNPIGFQAKDAEEPLPDIQTAERSLVELLKQGDYTEVATLVQNFLHDSEFKTIALQRIRPFLVITPQAAPLWNIYAQINPQDTEE